MFDERQPAGQRALYVALCSGKGGVGKSTVALLLAARLAEEGYRTLLIDADLGNGDISTMSNAVIDVGFEQLLAGEVRLQDAATRIGARLWLIGTQPGVYLTRDNITPKGLKECSEIDSIFDVVLIDTSSSLDPLNIELIAGTDLVTTVTTPQIGAVADSYIQLKKVLQQRAAARCGVIINRIETETEGEQAKTKFKELVERLLLTELTPLGVLANHPALQQAAEGQVLLGFIRQRNEVNRSLTSIVNMLKEKHLSKTRIGRSLWDRFQVSYRLKDVGTFDDTKVVVPELPKRVPAELLLTK